MKEKIFIISIFGEKNGPHISILAKQVNISKHDILNIKALTQPLI